MWYFNDTSHYMFEAVMLVSLKVPSGLLLLVVVLIVGHWAIHHCLSYSQIM